MRFVKSLLALSILAISIIFPTNTFAESQITVSIDGQQLTFNKPPVMENGTTLVPFRTIFEELGLNVGWNPTTNTVTGKKDGLSIQLNIGNKKSTVDGKVITLAVAPKVVEGTAFVPLRFITEASGAYISWSDVTNHIDIISSLSVQLFDAVNNGDLAKMRELLEKGANPNVKWVSGVVPLNNAILLEDIEAVELLISKGADVKYQGLLTDAVYTGDIDIVKLLVEAGAYPYNASGTTALNLAKYHNYTDIVTYLESIPRDQASDSFNDVPTKDKNFNLPWGMSESQIRATRSEKPEWVNKLDTGKTHLLYTYKFDLGEKGKVLYTFDSNGLSEVMFLTDGTSDFDIPYGVYAGQNIDLSDVYNNGEMTNFSTWKDSITKEVYEEVYANDVRRRNEMAISAKDLTLHGAYESKDSNILVSLHNGGTTEKPSYIASVRYSKK